MQGYDIEAAVPFIAAAAGVRAPRAELESFVRRAIGEDFHYMQETGVLDEQGYMGEGEYDDDEAFEALLERLGRPQRAGPAAGCVHGGAAGLSGAQRPGRGMIGRGRFPRQTAGLEEHGQAD